MYIYPTWGYVIGWLMALSSMLCIPLWIFIKLWKTEGTLPEVSSWGGWVWLDGEWWQAPLWQGFILKPCQQHLCEISRFIQIL